MLMFTVNIIITQHTHTQWYATSEPLITCIVDMYILDQSSKLGVGMPTGKLGIHLPADSK